MKVCTVSGEPKRELEQCDCLKVVMDKREADLPFERPLTFNWSTGGLKVGSWAAKLFKRTPSGGISRKSCGYVFLNFCPICGRKLIEQEEREDEQSGILH